MRSRSIPAAAAVLAMTLSVSLAACSDDEPTAEDAPTSTAGTTSAPAPSETATTPAASDTATVVEPPTEPAGTVVTITIEGGEISPNGKRIEVERDEAVTLDITSDRAGELHVHGKPEQYVEFEAGTSTHELTISAPGVVDVEDHETGIVIVQLEVS